MPRLVGQVLVREEGLLAGRPDERLAAGRTPQFPVLQQSPDGLRSDLLHLSPLLLAASLPCESLLRATFVARLQVEGVFLDVLDDVLLLHLPLEPTEGALDGLTFLDFDLGQL